MSVYITKYALTTGIEVHDVQYGSGGKKYVYTKDAYHQQFVMGKTAFHTYLEAAVAAREMRDKKRDSLNRQLAKVSGLLFPMKMPARLH